MRYQHRNQDIAAVEWGGGNIEEVRDVLKGSQYSAETKDETLHLIRRGRELFRALRGEWIVRDGFDVTVLFPGVFHQRYQPVSE